MKTIFRSIICLTLVFLSTISKAQVEEGSFEFEGRTRNYIVFLPQNYQSNMPAVFNLHGFTSNAEQQMHYTKMNAVADTSGFIVVYPNAIYPGFNTGLIALGSSRPLPTDVNDIGFISALIDTMIAQYNIDINRIYSCGFSNGGVMTYMLTGTLGHRFAAMAPVAGTICDNFPSTWNPLRSFPILHIHGTNDQTVEWDGSFRNNLWSVDETLNYWIERNNCVLTPDTISLPDININDNSIIEKISYTDCEIESKVILYKVIDGTHHWPDSDPPGNWIGDKIVNKDINANVELWNFFQNYENPLLNLAFGKSLKVSSKMIVSEIDTLKLNALLYNPENHNISVYAIIDGISSGYRDSLEMFDDGLNDDGIASNDIWGVANLVTDLNEDYFNIKLRTYDLDMNLKTDLDNQFCFTTAGPIVIDSFTPRIVNDTLLGFSSFSLKNLGLEKRIKDVTAVLKSQDTCLSLPSSTLTGFGDISPGMSKNASAAFGYSKINCVNEANFEIEISSEERIFWTDTFSIDLVTDIKDEPVILFKEYALYQNHPNPFNPSTIIKYSTPKQSNVTLKVFDVLGSEVATLVTKEQPQGNYEVEFNGSGLTSGIYFYRLRVGDPETSLSADKAGSGQVFVETKKMVLIK